MASASRVSCWACGARGACVAGAIGVALAGDAHLGGEERGRPVGLQRQEHQGEDRAIGQVRQRAVAGLPLHVIRQHRHRLGPPPVAAEHARRLDPHGHILVTEPGGDADRVDLAQQVVHFVVATLEAIEPLQRLSRARPVAAPGQELAHPLERLEVVGLLLEQRLIRAQGGLLSGQGETAPPYLAQDGRITRAQPLERLELGQRFRRGPGGFIELGEGETGGHVRGGIGLVACRSDHRFIFNDGITRPSKVGEKPSRLEPGSLAC